MNTSAQTQPAATRQGPPLWMIAVTVAIVMVPFLFWRATWFGRPLTDAETRQYLAASDKPRHIQHALVQIGNRISAGDADVKQFYPDVIRVADSPLPEIRNTAAWIMGQDPSSDPFHQKLRAMLADADLTVRRNAALGLVRFHDNAGKSLIRAMLENVGVIAPAAGTFRSQLASGDTIKRGTLLGDIESAAGSAVEVHSAVTGHMDRLLAENGSAVQVGTPLVSIAPAADTLWEALRALYLVGTPEDLQAVERYEKVEGPLGPTPPGQGTTSAWRQKIAAQAQLTAAAIRSRR